MEYFVTSSYKDCERIGQPYDKEGKLYTKIHIPCDRCTNGIYAIAHKIPSMCSVIFTTVSISWQQEIVEKINTILSMNLKQ